MRLDHFQRVLGKIGIASTLGGLPKPLKVVMPPTKKPEAIAPGLE